MALRAAASDTLPRLRQRQRWRARMTHWLRRRIPPAREVVLNHRNIFIMPNRQGLGFLCVLALMFVGAINYQISLAVALVFLLLGMFVLSIFHTFRNLAGLRVTATAGAPVFAGERAEVTVVLGCRGGLHERRGGNSRERSRGNAQERHGSGFPERRGGSSHERRGSSSHERRDGPSHESLVLCFPTSRRQDADLVDTPEQRVNLYLDTTRRGWLNPGRLRLETVFPFGICRAWSLLDLDLRCLVYPRPLECDLDWLLGRHQQAGHTSLVRGNDDYHGLRNYQHGDSPRHVAWKQYARGQGMLTKQYASNADERIWLRWDMFPDLDTEGRLSRLCWCVLRLDAMGLDYGLELPGLRLPPAKGARHQQQALRALALYGEALYGETLQGEMLHGETLQGEMLHREVLHGESLHREALHGEALHGEALHGGALPRETPYGEPG